MCNCLPICCVSIVYICHVNKFEARQLFFYLPLKNNSKKHRLSFEDIFLGTLDTYTKKMNLTLAVLRGEGCTVKSAGSTAYMYIISSSKDCYYKCSYPCKICH